MTHLKHLKAGAALALLVTGLAAGGGAAQAGALFLDPAGSSDFILGGQTNDIMESIYGAGVFSRDGYYGSTIRLNSRTAVTFTFLGFEAEYDNEFLLDADGNGRFDLIFSNKTGGTPDINGKAKTAVGDTYTVCLIRRTLLPASFPSCSMLASMVPRDLSLTVAIRITPMMW